MYYCESCKLLCETNVCPQCGEGDLREPQSGDYCFLTECESSFGKMLEEIFSDKGIPCALIPNGNGFRSALGLNLENYVIFVPCEDYQSAREICDYFNVDTTEEFKKELIDIREKWHINGIFADKRFKKALKLAKDADLFSSCEELLKNAEKITDGGPISSCSEGGHNYIVRSGSFELMFNSVTGELTYARGNVKQ